MLSLRRTHEASLAGAGDAASSPLVFEQIGIILQVRIFTFVFFEANSVNFEGFEHVFGQKLSFYSESDKNYANFVAEAAGGARVGRHEDE